METLVRNWWAIALRGAVAIVFGVLLLALPGISLAFLVALYGAFALVDGIFSIVSAFGRARQHERWGSLALVGVAGIVAGLIAWFAPGITALVLAMLIGAWAIATGILEIVAAIRLRSEIRGEFWLGLSGALAVLLGFLIFVNPAAGAVALVWMIGIYGILFGISLLALSFRLRSHGKRRTVEV